MKKLDLKKIGGKLALGTMDLFSGGAASNVAESTNEHPKGKADWVKLIPFFITLALLVAKGLGLLSPEEADALNEMIPNNQ